MKRSLIFVLFGCFFSTSMFPVMRRFLHPVKNSVVRTCANQTPNVSTKSVKERTASIDEQLAKLVKNSEEQNERLRSIWSVCAFTAFCTWMLMLKPVKSCRS